jgi:Holliday junction resolvase RusA-like endonuclease
MRDQDLSVYAPIERGETKGRRHFKVVLPVPAWSMARRLNPNKSLSPAARQYRDYIAQSVTVAELPELPWLRTEFGLKFNLYYKRYDLDAHLKGLVDDLVKAGLMVDDKHWGKSFAHRIRSPVEGITVKGWELNDDT